MTNYGQKAYVEYRRAHREQGNDLPSWEKLKHGDRVAWEAAGHVIAEEQNAVTNRKQPVQTA